MSESVEAAPVVAAEAPAPEQEAPLSVETTAAPVEATEAQEQPKQGEPGWVKPAINRLTREKHEAARRADAAERERDLYKAMVERQGGDTQPTERPIHQRLPVQPDVDTLVQQRMAEMEERNARDTMVMAGAKELGEQAWNDKTMVLANLGATENPAFMQAIVAVPDGHKVVAELADQPERLMQVLRMGPVRMAAELGRMAAEVSAPKPTARKISAAPHPVEPVAGRAIAEPTVYDSSLSMREYVRMREKQAPKHLGGRR